MCKIQPMAFGCNPLSRNCATLNREILGQKQWQRPPSECISGGLLGLACICQGTAFQVSNKCQMAEVPTAAQATAKRQQQQQQQQQAAP